MDQRKTVKFHSSIPTRFFKCQECWWFTAATLVLPFLPLGRSSGVLETRSVMGNMERVFSPKTGDYWLVSPPWCIVPDRGLEYGRPILMATSWAPISLNSCWRALLYLLSLTGANCSCFWTIILYNTNFKFVLSFLLYVQKWASVQSRA